MVDGGTSKTDNTWHVVNHQSYNHQHTQKHQVLSPPAEIGFCDPWMPFHNHQCSGSPDKALFVWVNVEFNIVFITCCPGAMTMQSVDAFSQCHR